ncbi:DNA gyrase inhibitor YacG [Gayadomonas joobiniege]|uniref:DNA gyrase inhibitor YacG n=1 Tax=Gayadomonas joobiniege TaxID=1234606 RepID=UPI00035CE296|nr:DNA gyrase inhibitor YacG [Gayadomonas joobiniege]
MLKVTCPTCQKESVWDTSNKFRPFCCERCKLIDLGEWASERNRIPADDKDAFSGMNEFDIEASFPAEGDFFKN